MPALLAVIHGPGMREKALRHKGFSALILYVIFFVSFSTILEQFWNRLLRQFSNFLGKNGYGSTRDEMHRLSVQKFLAFLNNLFAIILAKHTNMRLI